MNCNNARCEGQERVGVVERVEDVCTFEPGNPGQGELLECEEKCTVPENSGWYYHALHIPMASGGFGYELFVTLEDEDEVVVLAQERDEAGDEMIRIDANACATERDLSKIYEDSHALGRIYTTVGRIATEFMPAWLSACKRRPAKESLAVAKAIQG